MNKITRLNGIDLCRGLAAFAVILVHSGDETWGLPISDTAIRFRYLFYFAVPFFLAASFYFGTQNLPLKIDRRFWQKKFKRIVRPYLLWSLFYVVMKTIIYSATHKEAEVKQLFSQPISLLFFGGASYHLYFIPLLLAGLFLLYLANYLTKLPNQTAVLTVFSLLSLIVYQLLLVTNNDFNLDTASAFPGVLQLAPNNNIFYQPVRIALVYLSWMVRCLPYFAIALLVNRLFQRNLSRKFYSRTTIAVLFVICIFANTFADSLLPRALSEIIIAYSLLLFGIALSNYLPESSLIKHLGACSFGIYLIHPFIKSAVDIMLIKFLPQIAQSVSIASIMTYTIISFLLSWIVVYLMQRYKFTAQYI